MDWKTQGIRVVRAGELDLNTAQTPGMTRAAAGAWITTSTIVGVRRCTAWTRASNSGSSVQAAAAAHDASVPS